MTDTYLPDAAYRELVAKLLEAAAHAVDPQSAVMEVLGEQGGVWPEAVCTEA